MKADFEAGTELATRTILCIDDNPSNLRLIERLFARRERIRLLPARQGSMGLELARQHGPDLILLDLHLPDINGDVVLVRLRDDPKTARIPVVMITADATANQAQRLLAAGAFAYISKPLEIARFFEVVDQALATVG